jgi:two-component system chemotaxis sensor kinase CheA
MGFGDDEEILQDFLVEAGEIIEQLSEQLVELEQSPDDRDLLNAIFRGFHTVKGGAGFLQLNAMVDCCHVTENLFDKLRNGDREVTPELMDIVLQALDTVTQQFNHLQNGDQPEPADPQLIQNLETLVNGGELGGDAVSEAPDTASEPVAEANAEDAATESSTSASDDFDISDAEFEGFLDAIDDSADKTESQANDSSPSEGKFDSSDEITEDEFESLLDQLHGSGKGPGDTTPADKAPEGKSDTPVNATASDEITEDEFESLLDELHGKGKSPNKNASAPSQESSAEAKSNTDSKGSSDLITDDEFEDLLDQLHGKGKGPAETSDSKPQPAAAPKAAAPAPKPEKAASAKKVEPTKSSSVTDISKVAPKTRDTGKKPGAGAAGGNQQSQGETTVRVDTQRLDDIMNMVGELVLVRNRLVRLGEDSADESMQKAVGNLDVVTADLQTAVMKTRMQPIKKVFGRFPRVVRDLARNLKKEINLELKGEDTDLDKNLVEALADPLVHLVRNSVDHGIELPAEREKTGKSRVGKVILAAEQEGDHILLSITDDGGGMDPEKLREKAVEKGIMDSDAAGRLSDSEAYNLIFAPGFSTKTEISDVSGRGVGMDVVKTKITQLNGSIEIQSALGEGTRIIIKVPLTLAIMPTLMIMLGQQTFALPLVSVNEIFHMDLTKIRVVDGQECIVIREKTIPLFNLKHWLVKNPSDTSVPDEGHVVIVSVGTQRVGFIVDQLIGQEEVVIKPLGKLLHGTPGMSGATITGDGTIALILDVPSMLKRYAGSSRQVA